MIERAGRFITFEGGEGAGKSTQIRLLEASLKDASINTVRTREPGGTPSAEAIRDLVVGGRVDKWDPLSELFLMMAARQDHIHRLIRPSLDRGCWVISDRFYDSSRVYQGIAGRLGLKMVDRFHQPIMANATPDLTIIIDLDSKTGLERRAEDDGQAGRFEAKGLAFHEKVRQGFLYLARLEPARFVIIAGNQSRKIVQTQIAAAITSRFGVILNVG